MTLTFGTPCTASCEAEIQRDNLEKAVCKIESVLPRTSLSQTAGVREFAPSDMGTNEPLPFL